MANDVLNAMKAGALDLEASRRKHASLKAKADARVAAAKRRHRAELETAAEVEAAAWARLAEIPGMTVGTAAAIGGTSEPTASKWIRRGRTLTGPSCS
jgi:hypothetical protein